MPTAAASSRRRMHKDGLYFAGIDGGGTKTLAIVTDAQGRVLGRGLAGPTNPHIAGWAAAEDALRKALARALKQAGLRSFVAAHAPVLESLCLGVAGISRSVDVRRMRAHVRALGVARRVKVVTDGEILLATGRLLSWPKRRERRRRSARINGFGPRKSERRRAFLALVAGTGSICWGEDARGTVARAGGWGHVLGDPGSGYALGLSALRHLACIHDGAARGPRFVRAFLRHAGMRELRALLLHYAHPERPRSEIAALARVVFRLAWAGEPGARKLMAETAQALADLAETVAGRFAHQPLELVMGGGLLANEPRLRAQVLRRMRTRPHIVTVVREPAVGAAFLARTASGRATIV